MGAVLIFRGDQSCMQFSSGSQLIVEEDAHLTLGHAGQGILALRSGGSIRMKKNSQLTLDLNIEMHELAGDTRTDQIDCHLSPGAKLVFTKQCQLSNQYSLSDIKLMVYLNNGAVDLSNLSAHERSLIKFGENDSSQESRQHKVEVYPNPVKQIAFVGDHADLREIEIYSANGRLTYSVGVNQPPVQPTAIPMTGWAAGTYFVRLRFDDGTYEMRKLLKF